jgi:uncharacterized peroxidase-related enzyme
MTIIRAVPEDEVSERIARYYAEDRAAVGHVPAYTRTMAVNPDAYAAFRALTASTFESLGFRGFELVTLAAALGTGSRHCRLAHGLKSLKVFDEAQLERIAADYADAGLTDAEVAMMRFAEQVARDAASMTDADSRRLRDAGFSDRQIVDITVAAAARVYFGRALQALHVEVDVPSALSEPLRTALLDGL